MPTRPPKYPRGATLQCPCGMSGSVAVITGHRTRTPLAECKTGEPKVISPEHLPTPHQEIAIAPIPTNASNFAHNSNTLDFGDPPVSEPQPDPDDDDDGEDEPQPAAAAKARPGPGAAPADPPAPPTAKRPFGSAEFRQPGGVGGPARVHRPPTPTIRVTLDLSTECLALYDAVRGHPDFSYEGTLSDFVNEVVPELFELMGYGVKMVRMVQNPMPGVAA